MQPRPMGLTRAHGPDTASGRQRGARLPPSLVGQRPLSTFAALLMTLQWHAVSGTYVTRRQVEHPAMPAQRPDALTVGDAAKAAQVADVQPQTRGPQQSMMHRAALLLREGVVHFAQKAHLVSKKSATTELTQDEAVMNALWSALATTVFWVVVVFVVAWWYKLHKATPRVDIEKAAEQFKDQNFSYHQFRFWEEPEICVWSCLCPCIRWADTVAAMSMVGFNFALCVSLSLWVLDICTGGVVIWVVMAVVFTYYRREIRKRLAMNTAGKILTDFVLWCFCPCCAILQEARQIQDAPKMEKMEEEEEAPAEVQQGAKEAGPTDGAKEAGPAGGAKEAGQEQLGY